ncbi:MAG: prepilin-type N-terminal cleavage/methylation domain-containing protein [Desulfobacterales bacterium]
MKDIHFVKMPGFTLLEIMVSLSILAIVMVSVFKMHAQTILMADSTKFYATAPLLAYQKLSEMDVSSDNKITGEIKTGQFGKNFPEYRWSVVIKKNNPEILGEISEDLKRIDIKISLDNDEQTYHLRAYKFIRP